MFLGIDWPIVYALNSICDGGVAFLRATSSFSFQPAHKSIDVHESNLIE